MMKAAAQIFDNLVVVNEQPACSVSAARQHTACVGYKICWL